MDTAKVYQDQDGNDCSIVQLVRRDPHWAANRVQEGEKAIAKTIELKCVLEDILAAHELSTVDWDAMRRAKALIST